MHKELRLEPCETIAWEARPSPRCYTFRHWRHSIFGLVFLLLSCIWEILGMEMAVQYDMVWLEWLPLPFVLIGVYFSVGHLLQARLEWNNVRYLITNKRMIALRGLKKVSEESLLLSEVSYFSLKMHGEQLGTLRVHAGDRRRLTLHCLEYPRQATDLLEKVIKGNSERKAEGRDQQLGA